jgi:plasmid stabilization system protein ParE
MRRYRVIISDMARWEIVAIGRHIKAHNPARSQSFVAELLQRCQSLRDFPQSHALIDDPKSRGIRRLVHGQYLIFFRMEGQAVYVIHVMNAARDYERLLFPDDDG